MRRLFFLAILLSGFGFSYAQSISPEHSDIITTKSIVVKNEKFPTDDSAVYIIPVVSDKYPELMKALRDTVLFDGESTDSVINQYKTQGIGISYFSYDITYANKDIISLQLYYETVGAHLDESQQWLTLNIHTGKSYSLNQEINPAGLKWLFDNYKALIKQRIALDKQSNAEDDQSSVEQENDRNMYNDLDQSIDNLEAEELFKGYVFCDKGIILRTEAILPHAVHDHEPDRTWLIPYKKLKPYILPGAVVLKK
jgi:hypothetical protein